MYNIKKMLSNFIPTPLRMFNKKMHGVIKRMETLEDNLNGIRTVLDEKTLIPPQSDNTDPLRPIIDSIHMSGYSMAQYLMDMGIHDVTVYVDEQHWAFAESTLLGFRNNRNSIVKSFCSNAAFSKDYYYKSRQGIFTAEAMNMKASFEGETVLIISPYKNKKILNHVTSNGGTVLQFHKLLPNVFIYASVLRPIYSFINNNPNIPVITFSFPSFPAYSLTEWEDYILKNNVKRVKLIEMVNNGFIPPWAEKHGYVKEDILDLLREPSSCLNGEGVRVYDDYKSKYFNIINGHRHTCNNPTGADSTIYFVGPCHVFGTGSADNETIPSFLQKFINENLPNKKISVENFGNFDCGRQEDTGVTLNSLPVKDGDIIIVPWHEIDHCFHVNCKEALQRPHKYGEVFLDKTHRRGGAIL